MICCGKKFHQIIKYIISVKIKLTYMKGLNKSYIEIISEYIESDYIYAYAYHNLSNSPRIYIVNT